MHEQNLNDRYKREKLSELLKPVYQVDKDGTETYLYTEGKQVDYNSRIKASEIDYKELLIKYINHIKKCVRADYIFVTVKGMNAVNGNLVIFTDEEISELNKLSEIELTGNTIE